MSLCLQHLLRRAAVDPDVKKALGQVAAIVEEPPGEQTV